MKIKSTISKKEQEENEEKLLRRKGYILPTTSTGLKALAEYFDGKFIPSGEWIGRTEYNPFKNLVKVHFYTVEQKSPVREYFDSSYKIWLHENMFKTPSITRMDGLPDKKDEKIKWILKNWKKWLRTYSGLKGI